MRIEIHKDSLGHFFSYSENIGTRIILIHPQISTNIRKKEQKKNSGHRLIDVVVLSPSFSLSGLSFLLKHKHLYEGMRGRVWRRWAKLGREIEKKWLVVSLNSFSPFAK